MSVDSNPYESSGSPAEGPAPIDRRFRGIYAAWMALLPIAVAIATGMFGGLLKRLSPQIDERYISLFIGTPWTLAAWMLAIIFWRRGHRVIAVTGGLFWTTCGLFAAWVTIGFWNG